MSNSVRRASYAGGFIVLFVILYLYFLRYSWTVGPQSDFANSLLMARSMLRGNILLRGWYITVDSFWLTDLPLYAIGITVRGFTPSLLHDVPAFLYTALVFLALALMLRGRRVADVWLSVLLSTVALVAIPPFFAGFVLIGPMHIGTIDVILAVLLLWVYRESLHRYLYWALVFVLLFAAFISDPFSLWMYYVPVALYSIVGAARSRGEERLDRLSPFVLATVSLVASLAFLVFARAHGGLQTAPYNAYFAPLQQMGSNLSLLVQGIVGVYGANFFGAEVSASVLPTLLRVALMVMSLWIVARTIYRWVRAGAGDHMTVFLSLSSVLVILEYAFSTTPVNIATSRYLVPVFVFSLIVLAREWTLPSPLLRAGLSAPLAAALSLALAVPAAQGVAVPYAYIPAQALASWLEARGLKYGYGAYWDASIVTAYSSNTVRVRPVISNSPKLIPFDWMAAQRWYTTDHARFLVFDASDWGGVNLSAAEATWGKPQAVDTVGPYTVAVWTHPLTFN